MVRALYEGRQLTLVLVLVDKYFRSLRFTIIIYKFSYTSIARIQNVYTIYDVAEQF